jgi:hypothetical protein
MQEHREHSMPRADVEQRRAGWHCGKHTQHRARPETNEDVGAIAPAAFAINAVQYD